MNCQHCCCFAATSYHVSASWNWNIRFFHDEAMLFKPPIIAVKFPPMWGHTICCCQPLIVSQPDSSWTWIYPPDSPILRTSTRFRSWIAQCSDKLRLNLLKLWHGNTTSGLEYT